MDKLPIPVDIVVFGGSFDPPHQGHCDCLRATLNLFHAADVLVLPTYSSPTYKDGQFKVSSAQFAQRLEMCRLAFADLPRTEISELEERLPRPNFTVATLQYLRERNQGKKFALLLGQDQLASFTTWKSPRKILELASLIVVRRGTDDMRADVEAVLKALGLIGIWTSASTLRIDGGSTGVALIDALINPAESSQIRSQGAAHTPAGWLPRGVEEYIKQQNLYS